MRLDVEALKKEFPPVAKQQGIELAVLFGSQASGKVHKKSDIDIAVLSKQSLSPADLAKLTIALSHTFKIARLELCDLKKATPLLLQQIALKSVLLYEEEKGLFARFRVYALKLFMEAKPLFALRNASLRAFLQEV